MYLPYDVYENYQQTLCIHKILVTLPYNSAMIGL